MNIANESWRSIWIEDGGNSIGVIDQTQLPHVFRTCSLSNCEEIVNAITKMVVRGAPLIGVAGAYGLMLALKDDPSDENLNRSFDYLNSARPTAVNLEWALNRILGKVKDIDPKDRAHAAQLEANLIAEEDVAICESIGDNGLNILKRLAKRKSISFPGEPLNVLTHCNAGWLATVDWGTALSPIYKAHRAGMNLHVWVDETRPRNQGASLTAFELGCEGIPHTVIADNAGGHLMQRRLVDLVLVGSDRTTRRGDVCNKIGTYLKALAARENNVPFYVALPFSTIDWSIEDGLAEIPIEIRSGKEVTHIQGRMDSHLNGSAINSIQLTPNGTEAFNPAFDVTPASLVSALITDRGVINPSSSELNNLLIKS